MTKIRKIIGYVGWAIVISFFIFNFLPILINTFLSSFLFMTDPLSMIFAFVSPFQELTNWIWFYGGLILAAIGIEKQSKETKNSKLKGGSKK